MRVRIMSGLAAAVLLAGCAAPLQVTLTPSPLNPSSPSSSGNPSGPGSPTAAASPTSSPSGEDVRTYVGPLVSPATSGGDYALTWQCTSGKCTLFLDPAFGTAITFVDVGDGAYSLTAPPVGDPCGTTAEFVPGLTGQLTVDADRLIINATTDAMRVTCDGTRIKAWPSVTISFDGNRQR